MTVLLFCWHSYVTESASGLYFVSMNYSVHGIMYGYYALMTARVCFRDSYILQMHGLCHEGADSKYWTE